jgi:zinc/manganese transport system permease protein
MDIHPTWNLIEDVRVALSYDFMVNALRAGIAVALASGAMGWFVVMRREAFAAHTFALIGFPGAATAAWLGVDAGFGYLGFCSLGAIVIAAGSGRVGDRVGSGDRGALVALVQTAALAVGLVVVQLDHRVSSVDRLLFGTIVGVRGSQVVGLVVIAAVVIVGLVVLGRPLTFASVDPDVAGARGVSVAGLNVVFLLLLAGTTAGASQVTGSLLVVALLVAPAAGAARLTARPIVGVAVSIGGALVVTVVGEFVAFYSTYPIGFWVTTLAAGWFLVAHVWSRRSIERAK